MDGTLSVNGHRWMVAGVGAVVENGFRPHTVPPIQHRQTVRGRCGILASIHHDQFTLFARIYTKPVNACVNIEIGGQARGGVADARRPTVIARRMRVRHGDVGQRTVEAALSARRRDGQCSTRGLHREREGGRVRTAGVGGRDGVGCCGTRDGWCS